MWYNIQSYPHPLLPMLPKPKEKKRALALRKKGLSYSEILKTVPVAQATLSLWLRHIQLTDSQLNRLNVISQGAGARARRQQRLNKQAILAESVKGEIKMLLHDPFFMFGVALYWAEGNKTKPWNINAHLGFSNSDERTILIMRRWFQRFFKVKKTDFVYMLHIHVTANIESAKKEWAKILSVPTHEIRVTLKKHIVKMHYENNGYKGLIQMRVRKSTWILRRIELWIKHAAELYLNPDDLAILPAGRVDRLAT